MLRPLVAQLRESLFETLGKGAFGSYLAATLSRKKADEVPDGDDGPLFPSAKEKKVDKRMQTQAPPGQKPADAKAPSKSSLREYPFVPTEGADKGKEDPTKVVIKGSASDFSGFLKQTQLKGQMIKSSSPVIAVFDRKEYELANFGPWGRPPAGKTDAESFKAAKPSKWISAGGVVLFGATEEGLRKVLLVAPKGKYGGYSWTFPKGRVDEGENLVKTAKREVREETGIEASLLPNGYLGMAEGTSSFTHYYMMTRVSGEPGAATDGESEKVEWVTWAEAFKRVRSSSRDRAILLKAWDYTRKLKRSLA